MTVVARRIASVPVRTSAETWQQLVELVTSPGTGARSELQAIESIAAMLIAEEYTSGAPVTVSGGGPLVRIYTLHGGEAIDHDPDDEAELAFNPTAGNAWRLSLPAVGSDLDVARHTVKSTAHVEVRDVSAAQPDGDEAKAAAQPPLIINVAELERP